MTNWFVWFVALPIVVLNFVAIFANVRASRAWKEALRRDQIARLRRTVSEEESPKTVREALGREIRE